MTDVVQKLWGFCNTLRHDGINYGDYIEQLTYLLFLKLADEKGVAVPKGFDWSDLLERSGTDLTDHYQATLNKLGKEKGLLGDIFAGALSKFREPVNLKKLILLINETEWAELDVDLKAEAYEGLLQKFAADRSALLFTREGLNIIRPLMAGDRDRLKQLLDCLALEVQLCNQIRHSRPEEGSEHYFAYAVENEAGHDLPHGDLVGPGIMVIAGRVVRRYDLPFGIAHTFR